MTAAAKITNPAQESSRAGIYIRGLTLMIHHRTNLTPSETELLRWVVSSYGYLATALRTSMLQEWVSFSDFADLIQRSYSIHEPKTRIVVDFLTRLEATEQCFGPVTAAERQRMFKIIYDATHSDFKGSNGQIMGWAAYGGGLITVDTIGEMELFARCRAALKRR